MVQALEEILAKSSRIVFFGGAGVSTESGIPDFRSVDGLYHQKYDYPPETILSHTFWEQNPEEFYRFYRDKLIVKGAKPNAAHLRLAKLEEMLDCVCPALSGKTVRLAVGENGGTARQAAQVLAKRARYIELTPPGQTALAQWLLARYGVAVGCGGQPPAATVWCGTADSVSEGPAIYLGADCAVRQEVRYEAAGLAPWPVSEQLLAALLAADGWEASEIHVVSVVSRA